MELWWPVLNPIACLAVNVLAQIIGFRLTRGLHFWTTIIIGFAAGAAALLVLGLIGPSAGSGRDAEILTWLVNLPAYAALSYCYFNFANLGQASIRIRIYSTIAARKDGITITEITREYNEASMMELRLHRLVESGDIVLRDGRYFPGKRRFVPIANTLYTAKHFLLGKGSEFD